MPASSPLRVLFVSHNGGMAGAQQTLLTLLEGLDRERFEPHLAVPYRGELAERVAPLDIPVYVTQLQHWVPCVAGLAHQDRWRHRIKILRYLHWRVHAISTLIKHHRIDLVYTNTVTCIEGAVAARMTQRPHIWHIHEPIGGNSELLPLLPSWLYTRIIRWLSRRVVFPSHALAHNYPGLRGKVSLVPNGLAFPSLIARDAARQEVAAALGLDPLHQWVAVVGAIQPRKDHATFLQAAKRILARKHTVDFLIVGSGSDFYTRELGTRVKTMGLADRVCLAGRWPGPIRTVMAAIDVLVISSEQESFGLTAIESLALETPVVSTRCGGPAEIIEPGATGFLVNVKDDAAMADAVLDLLDDPAKARQFGAEGRRQVAARYTQAHYVGGIEAVMREVCDGNAAIHADATGKAQS